MRPTFLGFEAGRKGLTVAQKGLDVTGQNLTNIATPGYTRQRIDQVSVSAYGLQCRFAGNRIDFAGQGVTISGISQTRNIFLDKRFREEFSDNYYYQQKVDILADISNVVDELAASEGGLISAVNEISAALQGLTADKATDRASINILRTAFQGMVQTLHDYDNKLNKVAGQQKYDLTISVDEVNSILSKIAGLNKQITNEIGLNGSDKDIYGPNELLDERNLLLDGLSRYGDIDVATEVDGTVTVKFGDHEAVKGDRHDIIRYLEHEGGTVALSWNTSAETLKTSTGSLKAAVEMINGRGPDVQSPYESSEKGVLYYKDRADTLARTLSNVMNNVLPRELDDQGKPVGTEYKNLLGALTVDKDGKQVSSQDVEITAANITISDEWTADVTYAFPSATSTANAQYFSKMNTMLVSDKGTLFVTRGQSFNGTFRDYILDCHTTCVGEESFYQGRLNAAGAVADDLLNQRDSISAVSKDEETTNMMMYQKSFQAVSRLMTAMDEMLDVVINSMGLVGR